MMERDYQNFDISKCPLGQSVPYPEKYDPAALFVIPRGWSREQTFGSDAAYEFAGFDLWNAYELYWLDACTGRFRLETLQLKFPCRSEFLIESKSLKLYLFSLNNLEVTEDELLARIMADLSERCGMPVHARLIPASSPELCRLVDAAPGRLLDTCAVACNRYELDSSLLGLEADGGSESIWQEFSTNLFRSNCLVSGYPDWAVVRLRIFGPPVCQEGLLRYLVSFRKHQSIHEQCIERICADLRHELGLEKVAVMGHFTRRGGLDINPVRGLGFTDQELTDICRDWQRYVRQ